MRDGADESGTFLRSVGKKIPNHKLQEARSAGAKNLEVKSQMSLTPLVYLNFALPNDTRLDRKEMRQFSEQERYGKYSVLATIFGSFSF
jgi:hypothetical protein